MKIDLIYDCVYPFSKGGAEKRIASYADVLHRAGHDVTRVSMDWWGMKNDEDHIPHVACCPKLRLYKEDGNRSIFASFIFGLSVFWFVVRRKDVDVIDSEIFPYFPVIFARLALMITRRKIVLVGYWSEYLGAQYWKRHFGHMWRVGVMLEYMSYKSCDRIIANSHFTQKKLLEKFHAEHKPIDMIPPASIDLKMISAVPQQSKMYDIIYYGRIIWHKHVEHIVNVVEALVAKGHDAHALIIGDGPDRIKIERMIKEKKVQQHIEMIDFVDAYEELITKITSAYIMIQPSEREGFGITVAEANACGLPVFVVNYPDNAATALIEDHVNGFVCENVDDLCARVVDLLTAPDCVQRLAQLKQSSIAASRTYAAEKIAQNIHDVYEKLI